MITFRAFKLGRNPSMQLIAWLAQHDAVDSVCMRRIGGAGRKYWIAQAIGSHATLAEIRHRISVDGVKIQAVFRRLIGPLR